MSATMSRPVPGPGSWAEPMFSFGVTGTNGKTSTVWMLTSIVRAAGLQALRISTLGVDFEGEAWERGKAFGAFMATMNRALERGCRHAVVETTSLALADGYARSWRFDLGVFTNLSVEHFGTHGSWEHYLAAKAQLFMLLGPGRIAVLNAADPHALYIDQAVPADVARRWYAAPNRGEALRPADLEAASFAVSPAGTRVTLKPSPTADALGGVITTRMIGEVFGENALAAALAGLGAGLSPAAVVQGLADCPVVPGRFEVIEHGPDRPTIAVDYAHTPDALARTCATARRLCGPGGRAIVVFGAGGGASPDKRAPMGAAAAAEADLVVVTSDNPRDEDPAAIAEMLIAGMRGGRATWSVELDRERAIAAAIAEAGAGDVVVIAGKGHEDGQTIGKTTRPFSDAAAARRALANAAD